MSTNSTDIVTGEVIDPDAPGPRRHGLFGTYGPYIVAALAVIAEALNEALDTGVGLRELIPVLVASALVAIGKHYQEGQVIKAGGPGPVVIEAPTPDTDIPNGEAPSVPVD